MQQVQPRHPAPLRRHALALALAGALSFGLSACGGGGGGGGNIVQPTPPPPTGLGFTPTVATDNALGASSAPAVPGLAPVATITDPNINYHLNLINAAGALGQSAKGQGVTIGLLDSGVNRRHVTLNGRVKAHFVHVNPAVNNTSVDDVVGHGTTVASLAAGRPATGNFLDQNGQVTGTGQWGGGVAQNANIVSSRIIADRRPEDDGSGQGNEIGAGQGYGDYFRALNAELANAGARIINNSWGGLYWNDPALTPELTQAWKDFTVNRGGIIVFANGNSGDDERYRDKPSHNAMLPSMHGGDAQLEKGWITVGALDQSNPTRLTSYSQECGPAMNYCLVAPGTNVFIHPQATTQADSGLYRGGGTSYAAPLVSGALALVWAQFPYFTNDQVRQTVLGTAKDIGAPGVDTVFGWGVLDVTRASYGPGNFAWGDFDVNVTGNSVWRNNIVGSGGLIKRGSGSLSLTEAQSYTGDTRVEAGVLAIHKGLDASNLHIGSGGHVYANGVFAKNVSNAGKLFNDRNAGATIRGNYTHGSSGNLGVWLGTPLKVEGTATLQGGQVSILGSRSGYTHSASETLLSADGGLSGTFASVKAAPNVFLDASLTYDANNAYLKINRAKIDVAAISLGLDAASLASATRVEAAFGVLDGGFDPGNGFTAAAGDLQNGSLDAAIAERALRSLGGQVHAAQLALTLEAMDAGRRSLGQRMQALSHDPRLTGAWQQDLRDNGALVQAGFSGLDYQLDGWMMGQDVRIGTHGLLGLAASHSQGFGWMSELGDRTRNRQSEFRAYAGHLAEAGWLHAGLGVGRFEREVERNLMFGLRHEGVSALGRGEYLVANLEAGRRFGVAGMEFAPYLGTQYLDLRQRGMDEVGGAGFGLSTGEWQLQRWQAHAGLRATREWRFGDDVRLGVDAQAEWQRGLGAVDPLQASYQALEQWMPIGGMSLARDGRLFGLGLRAQFSPRAMLRLDVQQRRSELGNGSLLNASWRYRF
ncbi:S8 family serine peptidase [Luteimonas sp. e5]